MSEHSPLDVMHHASTWSIIWGVFCRSAGYRFAFPCRRGGQCRNRLAHHVGGVVHVILAFHVRRSAEMMENIRALPGSFSLAFVVHKDDFAHLSTYVRSFFEDKFAGSGLHFDFVSSGDVSVTELLARGTYTRVFVTNQIWEELNEEYAVQRLYTGRNYRSLNNP